MPERKPLDLRAKTAPVAPAARPAPGLLPAGAVVPGPTRAGTPVPLPGLFNGGLPLPAGTVVRLSTEEQQLLDAAGWQQGDPVPDIATAIADARRTVLPDPTMPQVALPPETALADLPPEHQQAVINSMREMIEQGKRLADVTAHHVTDPTAPNLNQQIDQIRAGSDQFRILPPTPRPAVPAQPTPVAEIPEREQSPPPPLATAAPVVENCPNCHFQVDQDPISITNRDKFDYRAMLEGGAPFVKEYPLFGGAVTVALRTLSRQELDLAVTQASCDARDGLVPINSEFLRAVSNYELAISLHRIASPQRVVNFPITIDDVEVDLPEPGTPFQTKLKTYAPYVMAHITSASLLRILMLTHAQFNALVRRMDANCYNEDFFTGIASPA